MLKRTAGLVLALLALPAAASPTALTGLSTSVGLAGALLALLASQGGSPASVATVLGLAVLLLMLGAAMVRVRGGALRFLPVLRQGGAARPLLARAVRSDAERALLRTARDQFLSLQAAWDAADMDTLRRLTTEGMFKEIEAQLPERGHAPNLTEVLALEAHLIAHESFGALELASIEFSGVVRESTQRGAAPFREVWMLARQGSAEPWRLARQQTLL